MASLLQQFLGPSLKGSSALSYCSIVLNVGGREFSNVLAINYGDGLEPGVLIGTSGLPSRRTRGTYEVEGSLEMYLTDYHVLVDQLKALSKPTQGFMEVPFDVTVTYQEPADMVGGSITDTLESCRIQRVSNAHSVSNEPLKVTVTLHVMRIKHNGADPVYDRSRG